MSSSGSKGTIQTNEEVIEELTRDIGGVRTGMAEQKTVFFFFKKILIWSTFYRQSGKNNK